MDIQVEKSVRQLDEKVWSLGEKSRLEEMITRSEYKQRREEAQGLRPGAFQPRDWGKKRSQPRRLRRSNLVK